MMRRVPEVANNVFNRDLRFSFIIANFNYGRFVARAIDSALSVEWPAVEVIVVDDGSTDHSPKVIDTFGDRITAIFQQNSGQRVANNVGFAASSGEVVVFLDADDVVEPALAREVALVWTSRVSKVQVQMQRVDEDENPIGSLLPNLRRAPTSAEIWRSATTTSEYPTPPGSGNAYSRAFLNRFFPIGPEHDSFTDSTCLVLAPLLGDVVTVVKPLVRYRRHGGNHSHLLADEDRFGREVARAMQRQESAEIICASLGESAPPPEVLRRNRHLLQLRVASLRLRPKDHPFPDDSRVRIFADAFHSVFRIGLDPIATRLMVAGWSALAAIAPRTLARRLIVHRFGRVQ